MQSNSDKKFPEIMGIVNVTPDSFSDGGNYFDLKAAADHGLQLLEDGADIIDIGGESTRPFAEPVSADEEMARVVPVIKELKKSAPECRISIDTTKYDVASAAFDAGAEIINDISGLQSDIRLAKLAADNNLTLIIMHMRGTPQNMQKDPQYSDVVKDVYSFLAEQVKTARDMGVNNIIIDVGIGFGKKQEHNLELLKNLEVFSDLHAKMLLGISRKSFLGKLTGIEVPAERDVATALLHAILLDKPVDIIRVHNVKLLNTLKKLYSAVN
jgi:dihydropteroate synthase